MSISEFSKRIGISRKTYYAWENEITPVLMKYGRVIEGALTLDIEDISEEDKEKLPKEFLRGLSTDLNAIRNRNKWAFDYVIKEYNLSNVKLAKILGLSESTVDNYRRGVKMPKFETLVFIQQNYKISIDWIMDGTGEPYLGARAKYFEVCGPEPAISLIAEQKATHAGASQEINIDEAWGKTYKVLKSGTPYAVALYLNIQQFSSAVDMSAEIHNCKEEISNLKDEMADLKRQVNRLTAPPITADQPAASSEKEAM